MSLLIKIMGALIILSLSFSITLALLNKYDENLGLEQNVDRPGNDYLDLDLSTDAPQLCRQTCLEDKRCRAFAHKDRHCWLKNAVPQPTPSSQFVSGVVRP
jgi:hypothetical protein